MATSSESYLCYSCAEQHVQSLESMGQHHSEIASIERRSRSSLASIVVLILFLGVDLIAVMLLIYATAPNKGGTTPAETDEPEPQILPALARPVRGHPATSRTTITATTLRKSPQNVFEIPIFRPLMCVLDQFAVLQAMVPDDGLCDYIFYTEVFLEVSVRRLLPVLDRASFEIFVDASNSYTKTRFGFSFDTRYTVGVIDKQDILKRACGAYPNIRQYGILNLEIQVTRNGAIFENLKKSTLKILPMLSEVQNAYPATEGRPNEIVLGGQLANFEQPYGELIAKRFIDATQTLGVTVLVFKSHVDSFPKSSLLNAVGPNPWQNAKGARRTMLRVKDDVITFAYNWRLLVLMSVSMAVNGYNMSGTSGWMSDQQSGNSPHSRKPSTFRLTEYIDTCKITVPLDYFKRDDFTDPYQYIQARTVEKYLVIFDTAETLRFKVSSLVNLTSNKVRHFGIAAFHVSFDDFTGFCPEGRFYRLKEIKRALGR